VTQNNFVDLRSDTITKPSPEMRKVMAEAPVGDDVFGEDPTVNALQEKVASILGKEKAIYVPSGTMGNQTSIKAHTEPGDEILLEREAHIFNYETVAPAMLSNVQIYPIEGKHGVFTAEQVNRAIRPKAYYMPRTRLICLENTHNRAGGTIFPLDEIKRIRELALDAGIKMHLDGARLWNASVETGIPPREYARYFDSVSVCFSKGLGAPVGSAVAGDAEFIERVRRYRKIYGGGMRQAGIIAAGALYALEHNIPRLKEDHEKAKYLAAEISKLRGFQVDLSTVQTNIVIIDVEKTGKTPEEILTVLKASGVLLTLGTYTSVRAVTHLDVSFDEVKRGADVFSRLFSRNA
jgi:threonine aldolase